MCLIVDACVVTEIFPRAPTPRHPDAVPVIEWLAKEGGRIAVCKKLIAEIIKFDAGKRWLAELARAGRICQACENDVMAIQEQLKENGVCQSNDTHVLAIALSTGARVLYTRDINLISDFRNKNIVRRPRGKVYSSKSHIHVLRDGPRCKK